MLLLSAPEQFTTVLFVIDKINEMLIVVKKLDYFVLQRLQIVKAILYPISKQTY